MKLVMGILAVLGLGLVVLYFTGGYGSFDPSEAGRQAKAALKPGMSFDQACEITGDPKRYRIINRKVYRVNGEEVVHLVPAPPVRCTRERISQRLAEGSLPHGFICTYLFSATVAFTVGYDGTGAVVTVEDTMTFANYLHDQ